MINILKLITKWTFFTRCMKPKILKNNLTYSKQFSSLSNNLLKYHVYKICQKVLIKMFWKVKLTYYFQVFKNETRSFDVK